MEAGSTFILVFDPNSETKPKQPDIYTSHTPSCDSCLSAYQNSETKLRQAEIYNLQAPSSCASVGQLPTLVFAGNLISRGRIRFHFGFFDPNSESKLRQAEIYTLQRPVFLCLLSVSFQH